MTKDEFPRTALYKVLGPGLTSCHGGTGRWIVGKRRSVMGKLVPCENGIHVCRDTDIVQWLHTSLWLVRTSKERVEADEKVVVRWATLVKRTPFDDKLMRLFAADCAEHVLKHNSDMRLVTTIRVARRHAFGLAIKKELDAARAVAWDAARAAAWDTARAAAWDAARAVAWDAAWDAAWAAARAAARAAAWDAARAVAWAAAWAAEREWQAVRLFEYLNKRVDLKALKASVA